MAQHSQRTDGWPTVLWIGWRAGEVERREPLCRAHRSYIFEHYAASAHGDGRRGDHCTMCRVQPSPPNEVVRPRDPTRASGRPRGSIEGRIARDRGGGVVLTRAGASSPRSV
jgi:hypothetical protein